MDEPFNTLEGQELAKGERLDISKVQEQFIEEAEVQEHFIEVPFYQTQEIVQ